MTLAKIRKADVETLKKAIKELIQDQARITLGELEATSRTIMARGKELGISTDKLNAWAKGE